MLFCQKGTNCRYRALIWKCKYYMDNFLDYTGYFFWVLMFLSPVITIPLTWRIKRLAVAEKVFIIIIASLLLSFIFFSISFSIIFRNGMGPT